MIQTLFNTKCLLFPDDLFLTNWLSCIVVDEFSRMWAARCLTNVTVQYVAHLKAKHNPHIKHHHHHMQLTCSTIDLAFNLRYLYARCLLRRVWLQGLPYIVFKSKAKEMIKARCDRESLLWPFRLEVIHFTWVCDVNKEWAYLNLNSHQMRAVCKL